MSLCSLQQYRWKSNSKQIPIREIRFVRPKTEGDFVILVIFRVKTPRFSGAPPRSFPLNSVLTGEAHPTFFPPELCADRRGPPHLLSP